MYLKRRQKSTHASPNNNISCVLLYTKWIHIIVSCNTVSDTCQQQSNNIKHTVDGHFRYLQSGLPLLRKKKVISGKSLKKSAHEIRVIIKDRSAPTIHRPILLYAGFQLLQSYPTIGLASQLSEATVTETSATRKFFCCNNVSTIKLRRYHPEYMLDGRMFIFLNWKLLPENYIYSNSGWYTICSLRKHCYLENRMQQ